MLKLKVLFNICAICILIEFPFPSACQDVKPETATDVKVDTKTPVKATLTNSSSATATATATATGTAKSSASVTAGVTEGAGSVILSIRSISLTTLFEGTGSLYYNCE
jgi:hypothetical protein